MSSPASILSEMHNKRLLLPLLSVHLPLLVSLLPTMLQPAPAPHVAPLPSTPLQREAADILNDRNDKRRRLYWDWVENVLTLLWCCAESNTKILATLNAGGKGIVEFLLAFLDAEGLGMDSASDMNVDSSSKKGKKAKKDVVRKERVPLFVAVAAGMSSCAHDIAADASHSPDTARVPLQQPPRPEPRPRVADPLLPRPDPRHVDAAAIRRPAQRDTPLDSRDGRRGLSHAEGSCVWDHARVDQAGEEERAD